MKAGILLFFAVALLSTSVTAREVPVRNPFSPVGKEGRREVISADYHLTRARELAEAAEAARRKAAEEAKRREAEKAQLAAQKARAQAAQEPKAADLDRPASDEEWAAALKCIRVGGRSRVQLGGVSRTCIMLDGKAYAEGDVKSVISGGRVFSWRVAGLDGEKANLKLERLRERAAN